MFTMRRFHTIVYFVIAVVFTFFDKSFCADNEEEGPVILPSRCEVCKILAIELQAKLDETGKMKDVIEMGPRTDQTKKKIIKYNTSELRLIEVLQDPHICEKILEYNIHKERKGSTRFARGQSGTFKNLEMLKSRGVNIDLGFPYALWNETSAEVAHLHRECFTVVERYEEVIEDWYFSHQDKDIMDYLCRDHVLKHDDQSCLDEVYVPQDEDGNRIEEKMKTKKIKEKQDY